MRKRDTDLEIVPFFRSFVEYLSRSQWCVRICVRVVLVNGIISSSITHARVYRPNRKTEEDVTEKHELPKLNTKRKTPSSLLFLSFSFSFTFSFFFSVSLSLSLSFFHTHAVRFFRSVCFAWMPKKISQAKVAKDEMKSKKKNRFSFYLGTITKDRNGNNTLEWWKTKLRCFYIPNIYLEIHTYVLNS